MPSYFLFTSTLLSFELLTRARPFLDVRVMMKIPFAAVSFSKFLRPHEASNYRDDTSLEL
jgi:hypothetical protein